MKITFIVAALASAALASFAQPAVADTCITHAMNGNELREPICDFVSISPTGGATVPFVALELPDEPVVADPTDPTDPTEVPSTPLEPATPNPGVYSGSLIGTPFETIVPYGQSIQTLPAPYTLPSGVIVPAGTYSVIYAPNGMFVAGPVPAT